VFDILRCKGNVKGNVNQNHAKIPSHSGQIDHDHENKQQMLVRIRGKRNLHTLLVGM
jgi:hypothetical protein